MQLDRTIFTSLIFLLVFNGCSARVTNRLNFDPGEPLRVVVLPFRQIDENGKLVSVDGNLGIDNLSLVSSKLDSSPPRLIEKLVKEELTSSGLDVVSPPIVDTVLAHTGFGVGPNYKFDKLWEASPAEICKNLGCDAVLYGTVNEWDRDYYGVESVSTVGIEIRIIRAANAKEIFYAKVSDSTSRGLSKGPTGFSSILLEPLRGLDSDLISKLADGVVQKATAPLKMTKRPEFLNSPPPAILAASHDAQEDGNIKQSIVVLALGSYQMEASFSIGNFIRNIPMIEKDPGHYYGEYVPLPSDKFSNLPLVVTLIDQAGRKTAQRVGESSLSR
jgi:hypothetical protein